MSGTERTTTQEPEGAGRCPVTASAPSAEHSPDTTSSPTYASYLRLDDVLDAQSPRTDVPDERLFIVTHQALELWFSEALREIDRVVSWLGEDRIEAARRGVTRLCRIVELWIQHLNVLDTMPSSDFQAFRAALGTASGLGSAQFRMLEVNSGIDRNRLPSNANDDDVRERTPGPSLRHAFTYYAARHGVTLPEVYAESNKYSALRSLAEELVEYDILFNRWRHRHRLVVRKAIGDMPGTAGSSGAGYLGSTLDKWFFPEIWQLRSGPSDEVTDPTGLVVPLDGSASGERSLLGGKGWGLQQMNQLGVRVPPAFAVTTRACESFYRNRGKLPGKLWEEILTRLGALEERTGRRFGGAPALLVSVRSGAPVSMPGMMDTVLNVGAASEGDREGALEELRTAVLQVFESWDSERAKTYRGAHGIADDLYTAVIVQAMVFGDLDERSGTGVYVTRDPVTGRAEPFGEWMPSAQGEELVSGGRTPEPLEVLARSLPRVYARLLEYGALLERTHRNVVEIEFTVESDELYLLQVRASSGSPLAVAQWAVDLVEAGVISVEEALERVPDSLEPARSVRARPDQEPLLTGIGVSAGVASGRVVDDPDEAVDLAARGVTVILARPTTNTRDIHGFLAVEGVITERGGSTSHAAVVARQLGLPCVVGCGDGALSTVHGMTVTLDGGAGRVYPNASEPSTESATHAFDERPSAFELLDRWRAHSPG